MQKKPVELDGLRLMLWAVILFAMILVCALLLDRRESSPAYIGAVMVSSDVVAGDCV